MIHYFLITFIQQERSGPEAFDSNLYDRKIAQSKQSHFINISCKELYFWKI